MRIVNPSAEKEEADFARRATEAMNANPRLYTWAEDDPKPGEMLAIRWNPFTVLILRLDGEHVPALYSTSYFIAGDLPPLETSP
jgi:hypothetical protein